MILFFGYLGFNNYGDELLLNLAKEKLVRKKTYQTLSRKNKLLEHFKFISQARDIICLGGLWQDHTSFASIAYYSFWLLTAKLLGKKIHILANSIGPIKNPFSRFLIFIVFKLCDSISVRDQSSSDFLEQAQIPHLYSSDLAWLETKKTSKEDKSYKSKIPESFIDNDNQAMLISLKATKVFSGEETFEMLPYLDISDKYKANKIIFLAMQSADNRYHKFIAENYFKNCKKVFLDANDFSDDEIVELLKDNAFAILSNRFHALVLAQKAGLEIQALADPQSSPKIEGLIQQMQEFNKAKLKTRAQKAVSQCKKSLLTLT